MNLIEFLHDPDWDSPFYKILANNDTGAAAGHQGGVVIPKPLRAYLPTLQEDAISAETPTVDGHLNAFLFDGLNFKENVVTRYQVQTWGGERSPEARITDNLKAIRNLAVGEDVLLIQRKLDSVTIYRFILVRQSTVEYSELKNMLGEDRWGILKGFPPPLAQDDVNEAEVSIAHKMANEFELFDQEASFVDSRSVKVARSLVFREKVLGSYKQQCAVSNIGLTCEGKNGLLYEVDAAHIVPRSLKGSDDPRNGLALCKTLHWAFDRGLFCISDDYKVGLSQYAMKAEANEWLRQFANREISLPADSVIHPNMSACAWHRTHVFLG